MANKSRRLQHYYTTINFYIETLQPRCEEVLYNNIESCIHLHQKFINKGHTKENEIKQIEKKIEITNILNNGCNIKLTIHVSHYSNLFFDNNQYFAKVINCLDLPLMSIKLGILTDSKSNKKQIKSLPIPIIEQQGAFC